MREFREVWLSGGFKQIGVMVHHDDKKEIVAMLEVMKYEKLIENVNKGDAATIALAASRNTTAIPNLLDVEGLRIALVDSGLTKDRERQARDLLSGFNTALRKRNLYAEATRDNRFDDKIRALAICYSNLCVALVKYAEAIINSPKQGEDYGSDQQ
jgi:hypothetical protein